MPLTPCPDCGREVSTRARHCVHCGRPWPACGNCSGAKAVLLILALSAAILAPLVVVKAVKCRRECDKARKACCEEMRRSSESYQKAQTPAKPTTEEKAKPEMDKLEKSNPAPKEAPSKPQDE